MRIGCYRWGSRVEKVQTGRDLRLGAFFGLSTSGIAVDPQRCEWGKAVREPRPTKSPIDRRNRRPPITSHLSLLTNHFLVIAACAAAKRATGKRNGLQLT